MIQADIRLANTGRLKSIILASKKLTMKRRLKKEEEERKKKRRKKKKKKGDGTKYFVMNRRQKPKIPTTRRPKPRLYGRD